MQDDETTHCTDGINHVQRVEEALEEIHHLEYVEVTECPYDEADVRVENAEHMENALINNGMFAQFHQAEYVGHHVNHRKEFIDLRYIGAGTERSGGEQ